LGCPGRKEKRDSKRVDLIPEGLKRDKNFHLPHYFLRKNKK